MDKTKLIKITALALGCTAVIAGALLVAVKLHGAPIGIIGGADGPTAIFYAKKK